MVRKYDGSLLSGTERVELAERTSPTIHAKKRIKERCPNLDIFNAIMESSLVYWNQYGYIVVSLPNERSLIIDCNYNLVTVRNPSCNMYTNADRQLLTRWRATTGRRCYK